ncbi:MAG TPA: HAMP domain-containing sensor histidine kinase [Caldimonas sp.]|nr:HAMP domain-containing sensor histidine kinase [Caldimonas sp.]
MTAARAALGAHFRAVAPALIAAWRTAIAADSKLTASNALPRVQLEDHLPQWLESFAGILAAVPGEAVADAAEAREAEAHGLQRWQQGYDLHDVTREWGCLHRCLVAELERFAAAHPELPGAAFAEARMKLAEHISEAMSTSAQRYFQLERVEAAGSVHDLERALADVRHLERRRADLWQQAAHDLRGNLGVVSNVAQGLAFRDLPADRRDDFIALLSNNVTALRHLLDDVTVLARLQAGQEERRVAAFDAADLLRRLCDDVRPLADAKRLALEADGPQTLHVDGDAVKVRRIAQNLLLNALKYTRSGRVLLSWGEAAPGDSRRWCLTVEDSGPGFHAGPGAPIVNSLTPSLASETVAEVPDSAVLASSDADERPINQSQGEGLGLAIVKRLCDLLDAMVEIDTVMEKGTTVRVLLPRRYSPERAAAEGPGR